MVLFIFALVLDVYAASTPFDKTPNATFFASKYVQPQGCVPPVLTAKSATEMTATGTNISEACVTPETEIGDFRRLGLRIHFKNDKWVRVGNDAVVVHCGFACLPAYVAKGKFHQ